MIRKNILQDDRAAAQYVEGVLALKDPVRFPWPAVSGLSIYDFFVFWHARSMMTLTPPTQSDRNAAHSGPAFLPWHRYMLLRFEEYLRGALQDQAFRLPYWDWAADAERTDPVQSPLWSSERLGRFLQSDFQVRVGMNAAAAATTSIAALTSPANPMATNTPRRWARSRRRRCATVSLGSRRQVSSECR